MRNLIWRCLAFILLILTHPAESRGGETGAAVLIYHRFGEDTLPSTNVRLEQFETHLSILSTGDYRVVPMSLLLDALEGKAELPPRAVVLTIDDGFVSVYEEAWPRLLAAGLPFTIFVSTEPLDRQAAGYITWDQLREMLASGLATLGHHGHRHTHMASMSKVEIEREIEDATRSFLRETGQQPEVFAYPFGEDSSGLRASIESAGFRAAFGQHSGAVAISDYHFSLPRFSLNEDFGTAERFRQVVNAKPIPVRDISPAETLLEASSNPPRFAFTVTDPDLPLEQLSCFSGDGTRYPVEIGPQGRAEVQIEQPLPVGRNRINCTLPLGDGSFAWRGVQVLVAEP